MTVKPPAGASESSRGSRIHAIELEDLIVHRYSEHDRLFDKADKLARALIAQELREGEGLHTVHPGSYRLVLPRLTPEAGALRCSVLAEQVARELRKLNPTSITLDRELAPHPATRHKSGGPLQAMRDAATRAMARMAEATAPPEEFKIRDHDKEVLGALAARFHPVWHIKNNLITAYHCTMAREGNDIDYDDIAALLPNDAIDEACAKVDATIYVHAVKALAFLTSHNMKAVLIVPIHFSTIDRLRFMGPLLEAGGILSDEAKKLMVFEVVGLPPDVSRYRLREPARYLRTRARALIARTGLENPAVEQLKEYGFLGVSADVIGEERKEAELMKAFDMLAARAEQNHLQSFVHGISSSSLAIGAMAAGFMYMDGDAIADPASHPSKIRPFEIDMLYAD